MLQTKREQLLLRLVAGSLLVCGIWVTYAQVTRVLENMDAEIAERQDELAKKRDIYNNLEGIEERFAEIYKDLYIPGEIDQQKAQVVQDLIDLIARANLQYQSVKLDENVDLVEDDFYAARLTIDNVRTDRISLAKFLYLVGTVSTLEIESLSIRSTNRVGDDTVRGTIRLTRLIPTKDYMQGIEQL